MIIKTRNSTYRVTPNKTHFEIEKIAETSLNPNGILVGWKHTCSELHIEIGKSAEFGHFITTAVEEVTP